MNKPQVTAITLERHIKLKFGNNKAEFARSMGVLDTQVTKWVRDNWIVADGRLYSPKREHEALK